MATGQGVADFLGQGDDSTLVALAGEHVVIITAMVRAYTRDKGFTVGNPDQLISSEPFADVDAVITTATARLIANPEQISSTVGGVRLGEGFQGFSLAETFVLNRYRARAS